MIFRSKIKWAALGGLVLSFVSLLVHLFLAKSSSNLTQYSAVTSFNEDLNVNGGDSRQVAGYRKLWRNLKSLESLQPYSNPRSKYPVPTKENNGFIYAKVFGGFENVRSSICDLVTIARLLNATLVIPEIQESTQAKGISYKFRSFSYLYDEEQFIRLLEKDVLIVKSLPSKFKEARKQKRFPIFKPKNSASSSFYISEVLPKLKEAKVVGFVIHDGGCLQDPVIRPLAEQDSETLQRLLPEIPSWVKNPDFDRIDWLNKFIEYMWPYLDKAICKTAISVAKPIIAEQIPKYKIDSIEFETFTLGTLPPTFQGMKVYVTDEKELIMEPSLKWAGNPNVVLAVKAFGLKAGVQAVDLQIFASPRITLKPLVPSFPCFAKIFVSLMEKPHVDFGLKLLGADLMSIPGLYRFVQELIKDQVASMYLWPRSLEVPMMDPTTAMQRPVGILHVKIVRAMKLKKKDLMGASDPYVKLKLTEDKLPSKKTTVKHRNLNPEWNEEFKLIVKNPETQALEFLVYDWEQVGKHDKMGTNVVPLKELAPDEPKAMTIDLLKTMDLNDVQNDKFRGQLVVEMTYKPFKDEDMPKDFDDSGSVEKAPEGTPASGGMLVIIVHEAQDVEGKHHTNPYVRILFRGEEKKTKHVKKNRDPRWEEEFHFMLDEPPATDKIHAEVLSVSSRIGILHPKECLGYVDINLSDVVSNKRINEKFHLIDSKNGRIQIELQWRTSS